MERDRQLEHDLLCEAKAPPGFTEQVTARLDHVEAKHGNTGWERSADELLTEMAEEAADIAGWAVGVAHQLDPNLRPRLALAVRLGVAAWREIEELRELLAIRTQERTRSDADR